LKTLLSAFLVLCCAVAVFAQTPNDVPEDHWAYDAVESLIDKGYVQGYPDGRFRGEKSLTRYEFAVVIARLVEGVNQAISEGLSELPTPGAGTVTPPVSGGTTTSVSPAQVTKEDLAIVQKLVEEFKVELTVIGTRLDTVEENLAGLSSKVKEIDTILTDEEGAFQTLRNDVGGLKKVSIRGYVQARYQLVDRNQDDAKKEAIDEFSIRRARLAVTGQPNPQTQVALQLDMGGNAVSLRDAYVQYCPAGNPAIGYNLRMGQMKWWFGHEVVQSSGSRETPERALVLQRLFPGERDRGFAIMSPTSRAISWTLGVYNGTGQNASDLNNDKDFLANVKYARGDLNLGLSGYVGKMNVATTPAKPAKDKVRLGGDLQYYWNSLTFKGEWVRGKGVEGFVSSFNPDQWIAGGYGQIAYQVNRNHTLVGKYSTIGEDPRFPAYNNRTAWDLGLIRWLNDNTRWKLFYQINKEEKKEFDNDVLTFEWIANF